MEKIKKDSEVLLFLDKFIYDTCKAHDDNYTNESAMSRMSAYTFVNEPLVQHFFLDRKTYIMSINWKLVT